MNLKTAASRLSVHYQTAYKLVRSGSLAAVKIGGTYEISDAALERYRAERDAVRAGAAAPRDEAMPVVAPFDLERALDELHAVAMSTTTDVHGAFDTAARVGAEVVGDACIIVSRSHRGDAAASYHDTDPRRRAVLGALVHAFGSDGPASSLARVRASMQPLLISHVPQDRLRAAIDPQHLQFLDVIGVHSIVAAPVVIDGALRAVVILDRATPGAPYGPDDVEFAAAIASELQLALKRLDAYTAGWRRRRELIDTAQQLLDATVPPRDLSGFLTEGQFGEIMHVFGGASASNGVSDRLTNGDPRALVARVNDDGRIDTALFDASDLEYRDEEREVAINGVARRVIVHRGLVRDEAAQPRALIVVAQPAP
jgi:excisionase family DNA binding protein